MFKTIGDLQPYVDGDLSDRDRFLDPDALPLEDAWEEQRTSFPTGPFEPAPARPDGVFVLRSLFEGIEAEQYDLNRRSARRAEAISDAIDYARRNPEIYAMPWDEDLPHTAERLAVMELASRLQLSEQTVRLWAETVDGARLCFPQLWGVIRDGYATLRHAEVALSHLPAFDDRPPEVLDQFDDALAELAQRVTFASFRRRAATLARKLAPLPLTAPHATAFARRRVEVEDAGRGMSWLHVLTSTEKAHGVKRSLTSRAKHAAKGENEVRSRDQLRSDLLVETLIGDGVTGRTPGAGAVVTSVFVTVPIDRLSPEARASVRAHTPGGPGLNLNEDALIPGVGPIDDATARQLFMDADVFRRVLTDPVTGVILDVDRRARKATPGQKQWLVLKHGACTQDGCDRLAIDADADHFCAYHGPERGPTNIDNLGPLCRPHHVVKDTTKLRHRRRDDGSIEVEFPTGHRTSRPKLPEPPPVPRFPPF